MRRVITILMLILLAATAVQGQITISGNVYGGGNAGNLGGSTNVKIYAADITGSVYGGARQADIAGCTYVNIDGANMTGNIIIDHVYGGNDVSGTIGSLEAINSTKEKPDDRLDAGGHHSTTTTEEEQHDHHGSLKNVSTFILTTPERTTSDYHIFVGSLFGSGNGDYTYTTNADDAYKWDVVVGDETIRKIDKPEAARTYVDLHGGTFGYVYAGGNNASVTTAANICVNNTSTSITKVSTKTDTDNDKGVVVKSDRLLAMGINTDYYHNSYLFSRVFGGNNKAEMKIRPSWHLTNGSIEYLYSGGDEGAMTNPDGILLVVNPDKGNPDLGIPPGNLRVRNVFAGCRKAPVTPKLDGAIVSPETVDGYKFPRGLAARVLIYGGEITDVYGGNDITGTVTGGSAIGIYSSIKGCVYGGGNGSYAYTDNKNLKDSPLYGDFYYDVDKILGQDPGTFEAADATQKSFMSANALNKYRPNAEQVSLRVAGTDPDNPVIINGAIYVGGNSATLLPTDKQKEDGYMIEFKIGSNVISDSVFLANNGASMVTEDILSRYASTVTYKGNSEKYSQMDFTSTDLDSVDKDETGHGKNTFAKYMDGVVMEAGPQVVFDETPRDPAQYENYSTQFGSFYCGGNVGSMRNNATTTINVDYPVVIFEKLVGGSNKAYVPPIPKDKNDLSKGYWNVQYKGGLLGNPPTSGENAGVKLKLNLTGVKIQPKRWINPSDKSQGLEWNTISAASGDPVQNVGDIVYDHKKDEHGDPTEELEDYQTSIAADLDRRLKGGNVYGGCYESGHVNGNVVINVNGSIIDRDGKYGVFDSVVGDSLGEAILYGHENYKITARRSGVILDEQGMDVYGLALNLFGGGYGKDSEIWGSTTINLNKGYTFQIFGGSEEGVIGKSREDKGEETEGGDYVFNDKHYAYDDHYSTTINVHGEHVGASKQAYINEDLAEAEFIYGGGFEGPIIGNTRINLGNGRVFNTFAGSCNADILGHTETYIGQWTVRVGETDNTITGFPWVRDFTYGGNDLGGTIMGSKSFVEQVNADSTLAKVYGYRPPRAAVGEEPADPGNTDPEVLTAAAYTEYRQGYVGGIFGGCYGDYDYTQEKYQAVADADKLPYMDNAFVHIHPLASSVINTGNNYIGKVFGAGQGHSGIRLGDKVQNRSYVLIDIPTDTKKYKATEVFGAGSNNGLGMRTGVSFGAEESAKDAVSAIVDLASGEISAVYGGSYNEGVTRRTLINVPAQSAIKVNNIFGGAYGTLILPPCDVYEANVNYKNTSEKATVTGAIYGGNNNERRSLYTKVNISSPVWSNKTSGYTATVYGAGKGVDTWSEYTEVNLLDGANVWEVYGGGEMGHVLNAQSVQTYMQTYYTLQKPSPDIAKKDPKWSQAERWTGTVGTSDLKTDALKTEWLADWKKAWTLDGYYTPTDAFDNYTGNAATNFTNVVARPELDDETAELLFANPEKKFNTHVIINRGATVGGYVYGGGLGTDSITLSGDTYATTYVALLGGTVKKDIYAAGTTGSVYNLFGASDFTASANAYIEGGMVRNVYGGGWKGNVGLHTGAKVNGTYYDVAGNTKDDLPGVANVVIGIHQDKQSEIDATSGEGTYGFYKGNPAIMRNAYGGGEGGAVFGTANITLRNGQIGYIHLNDGKMQDAKGNVVDAPARPATPPDNYVYPYPERYEEKINDETYYRKQEPYDWLGEKSLEDAGCLFGGGYVDNSTVDVTNVKMYGGHIRNSLFGGGEIAAIGRGLVTVSSENISGRKLEGIYKAGKTNVWLYEGHVERNVFGGGRGYNNLGEHGSLDSDGFVFGQTEVRIYGGQVGTTTGVAKGYGNVFGGGDVGYVYSAFEKTDNNKTQLYVGIKDGERYDDHWEGYYYGYRVGEKEEGNVYGTYTPGTKPEDGDGRWVTDNGEYVLTEDCKVLVEPYAKVLSERVQLDNDGKVVTDGEGNPMTETFTSVEINGKTYYPGQYVPTSDLNYLKAKNDYDKDAHEGDKSKWNCLDPTGIIIHNAVFAGGNTSTGSSTAHANTPSVFGNATATIHDVYHRDLITLGTGHIGGLYGDGNLTLVDGYRGLNITNYGTDYYTIEKEITIDEYHALPDREAAYYELKYTCMKECDDKDGTTYRPVDPDNPNSKASTITADDLLTLFLIESPLNSGNYISIKDKDDVDILINDPKEGWIPNSAAGYWKESGVLPVYAGRLMNSIQRADFCGVFGSRMVMQGARDRVPEIVDFTNYTINRVREVSLNQQHSKIAADLTLKGGATPAEKVEDQDPHDFANLQNAIHGNYFGIYNIVNYLGGLTSDVHFMEGKDKRRTDNDDTDTYGADYDLTEPLSVRVTGDALTSLSAIEGVTIGENSGDIYQVTITDNSYETLEKVESVKGVTIEGGTRLANQTYFDWKELHKDERKRNNGTSFNKVALASGVYLELTTEKSTGKELDEKDWGYITGVIELDLINVQTGIGGGFVYAKNEHRVGHYEKKNHSTLTALNADAITRKDFTYTHEEEGEGGVINIVDNEYKEWETSGNFVHSTQTIIDDCYNISGKYQGDDAVPAHYWYIKGSVYVYDQYISAYTGAPNAYSEAVDIPLTITAASHGTMKMLDVKPNLYAYYVSHGVPLQNDNKLIINDVTYYKNDPISYWDWYLLSKTEQALFVPETYVTIADCKIEREGEEDVVIPAGTVMLPGNSSTAGTYEYYKNLTTSKQLEENGPAVKFVHNTTTDKDVAFDFVFRKSNNLGHDTGYILTYKVNNPSKWDTWYTEKTSADPAHPQKNQTDGDNYEDGPTYRLDPTKVTGDGTVLGQQTYKTGDIISQDIEDGHKNIENNHSNAMPGGQGEFERAYMVTNESGIGTWNYGFVINASEVADKQSDGTYIVKSDYTGNVAPAYVCTSTIQMGKTEFIYLNSKLSEAQKDAYIARVESDMNAIASGASDLTKEQINTSSELTVDQKVSLLNLFALRKDLEDFIQPAYYCTTEGLYGGNFYESGINYRGLAAWSSMSEGDRGKFIFNYDALDLLIDPQYTEQRNDQNVLIYPEGKKYLYDGQGFTTEEEAKTNPAGYSVTQPVDYTATYNGTSLTLTTGVEVIGKIGPQTTINTNDELTRTAYESLPNEQRHYTGIVVKNGKLVSGSYKVYVVNTAFQIGNTPYAVGSIVDPNDYTSSMSSDVTELSFRESEANSTYYYCREGYEIEGHPVKDIDDTYYSNGQTVPVGTVIGVNDASITTYGYEGLADATKLHYAPITVGSGGGSYYVVNTEFMVDETTYTVGSTIAKTVYDELGDNQAHVTVLTFGAEEEGTTYYYCKDSYTVASEPVKSIKGDNQNGYGNGATVPVGVIIGSSNITDGLTFYGYSQLPNDQKNFTIHGISPTETSTLFVSRESDIFDLSKEKIITAVYEYNYEETDKNGNVTPVSERHVVNIHISFKSGVPSVEDIKAPQLVLPGTKVGLREPNVTPGAYEVTGGGWELFRTATEAESHFNGREYSPATDSLYWYQNNWYVAYYAKTYLGKTYSNHVQVSVANYHDLKKVMEAKEHHYYIDNEYVGREPKVYINDYSKDATGSKNGLDLLKSLYDLSLLTEDDVNVDEDGLITTVKDDSETPTDSPFKGHKPLNKSLVGAGDNLEFILRTNVDHSSTTWNSIGSGDSDPCFSGVLHGDGYTISGLDHSLFDKLCGQVYNLGVTGSFTGAGVAETGSGYVENCWVKTSAFNADDAPENTAADKILQTGTGHYAVFGNPSRTGDTGLMQVVNCYYPESNAYTVPTGTALDHGKATKMSDKAFYNGEVAYDLNGFYLKKRYYDNNNSWKTGLTDEQKKSYNYLKANTDGTLPDEMTEGNYPEDYACYPLSDSKKVGHYGPYGYVEDRFADGDYIYAGGIIPETSDIRIRTKTETINNKEVEVTYYTPIWPDDYLFFGQALNYGHMDGNGGRDLRTHQDVPSHIAKSSDRIDTDVTGNRVYRAPAYYRSSEMGVAYFNPHAVFAATKKGNTAVKAYENMTAIDFTGHNDVTYGYLSEWQQWSKTSQTAQDRSTEEAEKTTLSKEAYAFYPPLLDDGGVRGFVNIDLTKNLLAYTCVDTSEGHANDACNVTDATISANLPETPYAEGNATGSNYVAGKVDYRTVAYSDPVNIIGHWVQKSSSGVYKALRDHQLVDKQDFNAPISYTFMTGVDGDYRMWYQRTPDNFAGQEHDMDANGNPVLRSDAGWESISLPFAAELVTTNVKGEITHFYSDSATAYNDEGTDHTKKGHEYWLREFTDIKEETQENVTTAVADFKYPTSYGTEEDKTVTNTFLWDYYYKATTGHNQLDKNGDTYQTYYQTKDWDEDGDIDGDDYVNKFTHYPLLQGGTPYIIGFPGARYYEFDLSGGFEAYPTTASHLNNLPAKLSKQTITFASEVGAEIAVSDDEMKLKRVKQTYSGTDYYFYPNYLNIEMPAGGYVMSKDGDAFNKLTAADVTAKKNKVSAFRTYFSGSAEPQKAARRIMFNNNNAQLGGSDEEIQDKIGEGIDIRPGKRSIIVTSNLKHTADVRIFNVSGLCVANFNIEPGQTIKHPIYHDGVYIVHVDGGRYKSKLAVR